MNPELARPEDVVFDKAEEKESIENWPGAKECAIDNPDCESCQ